MANLRMEDTTIEAVLAKQLPASLLPALSTSLTAQGTPLSFEAPIGTVVTVYEDSAAALVVTHTRAQLNDGRRGVRIEARSTSGKILDACAWPDAEEFRRDADGQLILTSTGAVASFGTLPEIHDLATYTGFYIAKNSPERPVTPTEVIANLSLEEKKIRLRSLLASGKLTPSQLAKFHADFAARVESLGVDTSDDHSLRKFDDNADSVTAMADVLTELGHPLGVSDLCEECQKPTSAQALMTSHRGRVCPECYDRIS